MKLYEFKRLITFPFMPAFLNEVRSDLKTLLSASLKKNLSVLDVGGRKSPYTIGLPITVTLLDIPRKNEIQEKLNLGLTTNILEGVKRNRSNVTKVILEDMTKTSLSPASFDAVICVEVVEHVANDSKFVENIARVIKGGGWAYFTTPNGDYIKNEPPNFNPDHQRHYTRSELRALLKGYFDEVDVRYAVKTGTFRRWGLPGYTFKRPFRTFRAVLGNLINRLESHNLSEQHLRTAHLVAIAYKKAI
jgi:SAM-dependent methyltransferase